MHAVYDVLSNGLSVPVIHIADATADAIKKQGLQKVALLGTPFTMTQPFYLSLIHILWTTPGFLLKRPAILASLASLIISSLVRLELR